MTLQSSDFTVRAAARKFPEMPGNVQSVKRFSRLSSALPAVSSAGKTFSRKAARSAVIPLHLRETPKKAVMLRKGKKPPVEGCLYGCIYLLRPVLWLHWWLYISSFTSRKTLRDIPKSSLFGSEPPIQFLLISSLFERSWRSLGNSAMPSFRIRRASSKFLLFHSVAKRL